MNTFKSLGFAALAATALIATQAFATTCPTAPITGNQTQGSPVCINPVGQDGTGTGLNDYFGPGGSLVVSGPGIDVYNNQAVPSSFWSIGATGASENKITLEIAGNANSNTFGIFDPTNPNNFLPLFSGPDSAGTLTTLVNNGNGSYTAFYLTGTNAGTSMTVTFGATNYFGYYLGAASNTPTYYSDPSMNDPTGNPLYYPNGAPHMVAYEGDGKTTLKTGNITGLFLSNEYLLAWEDLPYAHSDLDYNDFVVLVESVHPVPEPAVLGMFGLGVLMLGGFVALRRRYTV